MKGQRIGYIRVSSVEQNTWRQLEGLELDKVFTDKLSGKDTNREQYKAMLEYIREGDTLFVHSMDRLARNLDDLRQTVLGLVKKGIRVQFTKENLIFNGDDTPMSLFTLSIMGAFAEFERSLIRERQREGIAAAKRKGTYKGRGKALNKFQTMELLERVAKGENKTVIAACFEITVQSVYNYMKHNKSLSA